MALSHSPQIVRDGLVLYLDAANIKSYPGTGTTWIDLSGLNNGTLVNGLSFSTENNGYLVFDGSSDYVDLGYREDLLNLDITQSAWVYATSFSNWHGIISNMPSWGTGFSLQIGPVQKIAAMVSGVYLTTTWSPSLNTWYNIVATHRSSDNLTILYVNGIQENSTIRSITYSENAITRIGCFYTSPSILFPGNISNVMSYNRALTAAEVKQNFEATRGRYGI
jgi:hypothetical protein